MSDWDSVTIIGKRQNASANRAATEAEVNSARRSGVAVDTQKKFSAGTNRHPVTTMNTAKLDRETDELHHERVGLEVGRIIQQARNELKMTQKDLAQRVNERPQTINDYESGRAIPNQAFLSKLERVLGVKLRGPNKGEKLTFGKPKPANGAAGSAGSA